MIDDTDDPRPLVSSGDADRRGKRAPDHIYRCAVCGCALAGDDPAALRQAARQHHAEKHGRG